ncbi:hypothetical protein HPB48_004950 [Haemaphysalis longicornis]|uniref:Uncharacterized protein n=1 Tax=Haemaphysalis longicornis TaxID=44386 RepID=A0A9J6GCK5_HAELO|nr:hypothetical protein HPB48_004950 [Haemaphysalis longicornis]
MSTLDFFSNLRVKFQDCRGRSDDNASNMVGKYSGMLAHLKKKKASPQATDIPYAAHSLHLILLGKPLVFSGSNSVREFYLLRLTQCCGASESELLANFRRCQRVFLGQPLCRSKHLSLLGVVVGVGENLQNATATVGTGIRGGIQGVATGVRQGTAAVVDNVRKNIQAFFFPDRSDAALKRPER